MAAGRRRQAVTVLAGLAVAAAGATVALWWAMDSVGQKPPSFAEDSGVLVAFAGPAAPAPAGGSDVRVQVNGVTQDGADVTLWRPSSTSQAEERIDIGGTLSLGEFTMRLCATWVDEKGWAPWRHAEDGDATGDRIYYVYAETGQAPACPTAP